MSDSTIKIILDVYVIGFLFTLFIYSITAAIHNKKKVEDWIAVFLISVLWFISLPIQAIIYYNYWKRNQLKRL